jgi:hypothetical protein
MGWWLGLHQPPWSFGTGPSPALGGLKIVFQMPRWIPDGLVVGLAPPTLEFWVRFSNEKNTHQPRPGWAPDPLMAGSCTSHLGVLGSIPKREEPGKTGRHPVLKYRVPHGSQNSPTPPPSSFTQSPSPPRSLVRDGQTSPHILGLGLSSLVPHVLHYPPPPS